MTTVLHQRNFPQIVELEKKLKTVQYVIGVDLHKKTTAITVFDQKISLDQPIFERKRVKNDQILTVISKFEGEKFVVSESAYDWRMMRDALEDRTDTTFVIFNPRKTAAWTQSSGIKSDGIDATILAYTCLNGGLPRLAVYQPDRISQERLRWINFRDNLVKNRTHVKNQLNSTNRDYGKNPYNGLHTFKPMLIRKMENFLLDQLKLLDDQIKEADKEIAKISKKDPIIWLLKTIPGIGDLTAFALRFKVDDISRFASAKHFSSYFGFGIRQKQSGQTIHKGGITKTGDIMVRKLLVQGAHVVRRWHPEYFNLYFPNLSQQIDLKKKPTGKLIIAVARKMLTFSYFCWKNGTIFSIEDYTRRRADQYKENMFTQSKSC